MGCCSRVLLVTLVIAACASAFASGGDQIDADAPEDEASSLLLASFARSVVISASAAVTNRSTALHNESVQSARFNESVQELASELRRVVSGTGTSASDVRRWLTRAAEHCEAGALLPVGGSDTVAGSRGAAGKEVADDLEAGAPLPRTLFTGDNSIWNRAAEDEQIQRATLASLQNSSSSRTGSGRGAAGGSDTGAASSRPSDIRSWLTSGAAGKEVAEFCSSDEADWSCPTEDDWHSDCDEADWPGDDPENQGLRVFLSVFPDADDFAASSTRIMAAVAKANAATAHGHDSENVASSPSASSTSCCWGDLGRKYLQFGDEYMIHPEYLLRYPNNSKQFKVDQHDRAMKRVAKDHHVNISNLVADDYFLHPDARRAALDAMKEAYLAKARVRTLSLSLSLPLSLSLSLPPLSLPLSLLPPPSLSLPLSPSLSDPWNPHKAGEQWLQQRGGLEHYPYNSRPSEDQSHNPGIRLIYISKTNKNKLYA